MQNTPHSKRRIPVFVFMLAILMALCVPLSAFAGMAEESTSQPEAPTSQTLAETSFTETETSFPELDEDTRGANGQAGEVGSSSLVEQANSDIGQDSSLALEEELEELEEPEPEIEAAFMLLDMPTPSATVTTAAQINTEITTAISEGRDAVIELDSSLAGVLTLTTSIKANVTAAAPDIHITVFSADPTTLYVNSGRHVEITARGSNKITFEFINVTLDGRGTAGGIVVKDSGTQGADITLVNPIVENCYSTSMMEYAGGLYVQGILSQPRVGSFTLEGGVFRGNDNSTVSAAVIQSFANIYVRDVLVEDNGPTGGSAFNVTTAYLAEISGTFQNNVATGNGGGLSVQAVSNAIINGTFTSNKAAQGGALYLASTTMADIGENNFTVSGTFTNNSTTGAAPSYTGGSAILARQGTNGSAVNVTLKDSLVQGNTCASYATLCFQGKNFTIQNTTVQNNTSAGYGAGAYLQGVGDIAVSSSHFINNKIITATNSRSLGGGLYVSSSGATTGPTITITGGSFKENSAVTGGGIYVNASGDGADPTVTITGATVVENEAANGGGLYIYAGGNGNSADITIAGATIQRNDATEKGGGLFVTTDGYGTTNITNTVFTGNTADIGGGIVANAKDFTISGSQFVRNIATDGGGGISQYNYAIDIENTTFDGNEAGQGGGIESRNEFGGTLTGVTMQNNTATTKGGALYVQEADWVMKGGTVLDGNAAEYGGGVYLSEYGSQYYAKLDARDIFFTNNIADKEGGAIYTVRTGYESIEMDGVTLSGNEANAPYLLYDGWADYATLHATHAANIRNTTYSVGTPYAYNNYDINFVSDTVFVQKYTVTFHANGGMPNPVSQEVEVGTNVAVPAMPILTGHKLTGWFTGDGNEWIFDTDTVEEDIDLYARWEKESYTLTFNAGGGSPAPARQTVLYGNKATQPTQPGKAGYTFTGWFTPAGDRWDFDANTMPPNNLTLTAQYYQTPHTVTFVYTQDVRGYETVFYGDLVPEPQQPSRAGYIFRGWQQSNGEAWLFASMPMPDGDLTLTAQWEQDAPVETTTSTSSKKPGGSGGTVSSTAPSTSYYVATTTSTATSSEVSSQSSSTSSPAASTPAPESSVPESTASIPEDTIEAVAEELPQPGDDDYIQPGNTINMFGTEIPVAGFASRGGWSLFNLILCVLMLASAVFTLVRKPQGATALLWGAILAGLLPLVVWPIVENMSRMILFSRWTPMYLTLFAVNILLQAALRILAKRRQ